MILQPSRTRGFTLIEVLVAMIIFAVMAVMAYRGLTAILETRARLDEEASKWRAVSLLLLVCSAISRY